jgi:hypothetical protein
MTVVEDYVRRFQPDAIILALRSDEHSDWQEQNLVERIASDTGLPLTVFAIDSQGRVRAG